MRDILDHQTYRYRFKWKIDWREQSWELFCLLHPFIRSYWWPGRTADFAWLFMG